jgi:CubicO group peptidase (beta-lactamase class C family)
LAATLLFVALPVRASAPADLQAILDARVANTPGVGILVGVVDGTAVHVYQAGSSGNARPLDAHTLFEIGSVTKTFTATILASMVRDGVVKLSDPVATFLPSTVAVPSRDGKAITLETLATQHSGLPRMPTNIAGPPDDPYSTYSAADLYAFLNGYKLTRDPGAEFEYSNLGVGLLGKALSNKAGLSYEALVRARVWAPLGMDESAIAISPDDAARFAVGHDADGTPVHSWELDALAGAGAIRSTATDMLKYVRCEMGQGKFGPLCLSTQTPRATMPGHRIGLIWWTDNGTGLVEHGGDTAGFHAMVAVTADHRKGVVVLTNGGDPVEEIAYAALGIPFTPTPPFESVDLDAALLDAYTGTYDLGGGAQVAVTRAGTALSAQLTGQGAARIYPQGFDHFAYRVVSATYRFVRDAGGKVVGFQLFQDGQTTVGRRLAADGKAAVLPTDLNPPVLTLSQAALDAYVGTYRRTSGTFTVARSGTGLTAQITGQSPFPIFAYAKDRFYFNVVDADLSFLRDSSGAVTGAVLHQNGLVWPVAPMVR